MKLITNWRIIGEFVGPTRVPKRKRQSEGSEQAPAESDDSADDVECLEDSDEKPLESFAKDPGRGRGLPIALTAVQARLACEVGAAKREEKRKSEGKDEACGPVRKQRLSEKDKEKMPEGSVVGIGLRVMSEVDVVTGVKYQIVNFKMSALTG